MSDMSVPSNSFGLPMTTPRNVPIVVLGPDGNPANKQESNKPLSDADRKSSLMSGYDSFLQSVYQIARFHPDALIQHKGWEYLYSMMTMAAVRSPIDLKLQATLYKKPQILPAIRSKKNEKKKGDFDKSAEIRDFCWYLVNNIRNPDTGRKLPFRALLWNVLQAVPLGFSTNELIWKDEESGIYKGKKTLRTVVPRPCEQVGFKLDEETLEVLKVVSWTPGRGRQKREVEVEKVILYTYKPRRNLPYGDGDLRACSKHYWSLDNAMRWWGIAQKKFGSPFLEGETSNPNKINDMTNRLTAAEQGASIVHTPEEKVIVHALNSSSLDSYQTFCVWHCMQIMMNVLGNTLTTTQGDGSSSYALGQTHATSQNFFLGYPRHDLEDIITDQLLERAVVYNYGEECRHLTPRLFLGHWDDAERKLIAEFLEICANIGMIDAREDWVRDMVDVPPQPEGFNPTDDPLPLLPGRERINDDINPQPSHTGPKKRKTMSPEEMIVALQHATQMLLRVKNRDLWEDLQEVQ